MLNIEDFKEEMLERDGSAFGVEIGTHKVLECVGYYCNNCLFHGNCRKKTMGLAVIGKERCNGVA